MLLMENAASALATCLRARVEARGARRLLLVAGPGNNGADALVAGRHLAALPGLEVGWTLPGGQPSPGSLGAQALEVLHRLRAEGALLPGPESPAEADLVVDGLFGVGLGRALEGRFAALVDAVNAATAEVVAVDLPSGLDATSGEILGAAVRADVTVSFVGPKRGNLVAAGPACTGTLQCADIGVPRAYAERWRIAARARAGR